MKKLNTLLVVTVSLILAGSTFGQEVDQKEIKFADLVTRANFAYIKKTGKYPGMDNFATQVVKNGHAYDPTGRYTYSVPPGGDVIHAVEIDPSAKKNRLYKRDGREMTFLDSSNPEHYYIHDSYTGDTFLAGCLNQVMYRLELYVTNSTEVTDSDVYVCDCPDDNKSGQPSTQILGEQKSIQGENLEDDAVFREPAPGTAPKTNADLKKEFVKNNNGLNKPKIIWTEKKPSTENQLSINDTWNQKNEDFFVPFWQRPGGIALATGLGIVGGGLVGFGAYAIADAVTGPGFNWSLKKNPTTTTKPNQNNGNIVVGHDQ